MIDIRKGDTLMNHNGMLATCYAPPTENSPLIGVSIVFDDGTKDRLQMAWREEWIMQVFRNGVVVWDEETAEVQLRLFDV